MNVQKIIQYNKIILYSLQNNFIEILHKLQLNWNMYIVFTGKGDSTTNET